METSITVGHPKSHKLSRHIGSTTDIFTDQDKVKPAVKSAIIIKETQRKSKKTAHFH